MKRTFKVALIGCGVISKNHLAALSKIDCAEVVALCDIKKEKAEARATEFGIDCKIYTDYIKMLDESTPDAVHVCTPHYLHAPMTLEALRRDIFVFLEKPSCISQCELAELIEAEKRSRASVCVCFQNRFSPSVIKALRLAREDGGARSGYASVFWDRGEKYYTESGWRGSYATEGGGVMINQAIHAIDLLCVFLGAPKALKAKISNYHLEGIIEVEDSCDGIVYHEDDKSSSFYATTAARGVNSTVVYMVTENHKIEVRNYKLFVDGAPVETDEHENYVGKACYGNGHDTLIDLFYEAVSSGDSMPVTLENSRASLDLLLAAYRSGGKLVEIGN